jgi:ribokinase
MALTEQAPTILVVGSANVDMIVRSQRLPGPGETVVGGQFFSAGGGKGANQAITARRLGARVSVVGRVGDDAAGRSIQNTFRGEGVDATYLVVDSREASGVALILVDREGQNMISVASGANLQVSEEDVRRSEPAFDEADIVVCQLEIPLNAVKLALAMARKKGKPSVLNPAPAQLLSDDILRLADWLTPNEFEASSLTDIPVHDRETAQVAARKLLARGARGVVVTLGDRGAILVSGDASASVEAHAVDAVDTTAAGDAFTGAFAVALARGLHPAGALVYANAAAALATTRPGAQPALPTHPEVADLLAKVDRSNA